jgi:hypothetical protein
MFPFARRDRDAQLPELGRTNLWYAERTRRGVSLQKECFRSREVLARSSQSSGGRTYGMPKGHDGACPSPVKRGLCLSKPGWILLQHVAVVGKHFIERAFEIGCCLDDLLHDILRQEQGLARRVTHEHF